MSLDPVVSEPPLRSSEMHRALGRGGLVKACAWLSVPYPVPPRSQAYFSKEGPDGVSVRSHLAELIHKLLTSKDPDALSKLESLSLEVKAAHFDAAAGSKPPGAKQVLLGCCSWTLFLNPGAAAASS